MKWEAIYNNMLNVDIFALEFLTQLNVCLNGHLLQLLLVI